MFKHIFSYNLKIITRSKEVMFWSLIYPLVLSTLFFFAFSNLSAAEGFNKVNIAAVGNNEFESGSAFYDTLSAVSDIDGVSGDDDLFHIQTTTKNEADKLLKDGDISAYLYYENGIKLIVDDTGLNQTLTKLFVDNYLQANSTVGTIISQNPQAIQEGLLEDVSQRTEYLKEVPVSKGANTDNFIICYYALLAMTCLMGSTVAVDEIVKLQANMSPRAARMNLTPVPKFRVFLYNIFAAILFQLVVVLLVLVYVMCVLGVDFGDKVSYIVLTCIIGGITGIFFGTAVSVGIKTNGIKYAITIGGTMLSCFLSGMMVMNMKYIVQEYMPIVGYISPANLISDAFYSLYYFDDFTRYFTNMSVLGIMAVLLCTITCLVLRRKSYASL